MKQKRKPLCLSIVSNCRCSIGSKPTRSKTSTFTLGLLAKLECPRKSGPCFELGLAPQTRSRTIAKRAKPEEIISKLREVEVQLSQGESVAWRRSRSKTLISQAVYSRASHVSTATMSSRASPNSINSTNPSPRSTQAPCNGVETVVAGANAGGVGSRDRCKTIDIIDMAVTALCRGGRSGAIAVGCRFVRGCGGRER